MRNSKEEKSRLPYNSLFHELIYDIETIFRSYPSHGSKRYVLAELEDLEKKARSLSMGTEPVTETDIENLLRSYDGEVARDTRIAIGCDSKMAGILAGEFGFSSATLRAMEKRGIKENSRNPSSLRKYARWLLSHGYPQEK